ncbi:MAG: DUF531 family protein [Candidatus Thermoplasmatota archaeon]
MPGRLTLGLYNTYDAKQWHDVLRVMLARAAPVAVAFDCDLVTFGFPYAQARKPGARLADLGLTTPAAVAKFVSASTSIGEGAEHLEALAAEGRFRLLNFDDAEIRPPFLGRLVATTPHPNPTKAMTPLRIAQARVAGGDQTLLFGLGPRGLSPDLLGRAEHHLELTGKSISLDTATALGALPAMIAAHMHHLGGGG